MLTVAVAPIPSGSRPLYFALAAVGIFSLLVGASVRLRRPDHQATLHFFWLCIAFFGVLAFSFSGRLDTLDRVFYWGDVVAMLMLPPLFLHFALMFPERPDSWARSDAGRPLLPLLYLPALLLGAARVASISRIGAQGDVLTNVLGLVERGELLYFGGSLIGGLWIMARALTRVRSVTSRRQLRWIVWGTALGALPFSLGYALPFALSLTPVPGSEWTAVLIGLVPLAFASAIVRYRLMDVEVIIKRALVYTAALGGHRRDLRHHPLAGQRGLLRRRSDPQPRHRAARHARRRAARPAAEERDSGRARSRLLPRSLRLPPRPGRIRARL